MKNILLIGLGRFGKHIAIQSSQLGHEIMAVDLDEERVNDALPYVTNAQIGDSTNEEFLKSLGIANYDICFVTIGGNFQNSLETTCLLKELGGKMVISRAERDVQEKFLLRNGADKVVYPEKMVAKWATIRYTDDHILDYMVESISSVAVGSQFSTSTGVVENSQDNGFTFGSAFADSCSSGLGEASAP